MHIQTHKFEKTYPCLICNAIFKKNKELLIHISENHENNGFSCTLCDNRFDNPRLLRKHFSVHLVKLKCDFCEKEFSKKKGLKEHLKVHTREKKYKCDICHKCFGHNQTLKSHILTHTGMLKRVYQAAGVQFSRKT